MDVDALAADLRRDEGLRLKPYRDTVGKLTIGYGRNLDDRGISKPEAEYLLMSDIGATIQAVQAALPWFSRVDGIRQRVLVNIAFNAGVAGLLGFKRMLVALEHERFEEAADELLNSQAARDLPQRYGRLAAMLRTGQVNG